MTMSDLEHAGRRACEHVDMSARPIPPDLPALAETVARWVDEVDDVPAVYLFGSRVRGDHRTDSDVDLCILIEEWGDGDAGTAWWLRTSDADYRDLGASMPGPLKLHLEKGDGALRWVKEARDDPSRIVLQVRKAMCLWTPPKPTGSHAGMRT